MENFEEIRDMIHEHGPEEAARRLVDIEVDDQGTVVLFRPVSDAGRAWLDENIHAESWQYLGESVAVDHRYAGPIIEGIDGDGLCVGDGS